MECLIEIRVPDKIVCLLARLSAFVTRWKTCSLHKIQVTFMALVLVGTEHAFPSFHLGFGIFWGVQNQNLYGKQ